MENLALIPVFLFIGTALLSVYMRPTLWMWRGLIKSVRKTGRSFYQ